MTRCLTLSPNFLLESRALTNGAAAARARAMPCAMRPEEMESRDASPTGATVVVMRLYVAGGAPNSLKAIANLEAICKEYLQDSFELEIIDVLEFPLRAVADGVLVTPSLAKVSPSPAAKIVGDLSDRSNVLRALGITE